MVFNELKFIQSPSCKNKRMKLVEKLLFLLLIQLVFSEIPSSVHIAFTGNPSEMSGKFKKKIEKKNLDY